MAKIRFEWEFYEISQLLPCWTFTATFLMPNMMIFCHMSPSLPIIWSMHACLYMYVLSTCKLLFINICVRLVKKKNFLAFLNSGYLFLISVWLFWEFSLLNNKYKYRYCYVDCWWPPHKSLLLFFSSLNLFKFVIVY